MGSLLSAGTGHKPRGRPFPSGWTWIVTAAPDDSKAVSEGRIPQLVLETAPLQREMAPPSPAPALYI